MSFGGGGGMWAGAQPRGSVVIYPQIRVTTGLATSPTLAEAGPTFGWIFAVNDRCYFEVALDPRINRAEDLIVGLGWAPRAAEAAKTVSWQLDIGFEAGGQLVQTIESTLQAVDEAVPTSTGEYARTGIVVAAAGFADPVDELHVRVTRIASTSDPATDPGLHHVVVIQRVLD